MKKILGLFFGLVLNMSAFAAIPGEYQPITPDDTTKYPETLSGYTLQNMSFDSWEYITGSSSGRAYYRHRLDAQDNPSSEPRFSNIWLSTGISSSNSYVGFYVYRSSSVGAVFVAVRDESLFTSVESLVNYLSSHPFIVLYKKGTGTTNNEFVAVRRLRDGALGYYCESGTNAGDFVVAYGMTTSTTAWAQCRNLFDPESIVIGKIVNSSGTVVSSDNNFYSSEYMPVIPGQSYVFYGKSKTDGAISAYNRINWYTSSKTFISRGTYTVNTVTVNVAPSNAAYAVVSCSPFDSDDPITQEMVEGFDWQFEQGSEATTYTPYCNPIKIATTKYNNTAFQPVLTALNNAVDTIKTVVSNTINQATAIGNLQTGKQQRPNPTDTNGTCPNYRQCLLVEDESGTPHWYEIMDPFYNLFSAVIPNNVSTDSVTSQNGVPSAYTQLEYIQSNGTQYIATGISMDYQNGMIINAVIEGVNHDRGVVFGFDQDYTGTFVGARDNKFYMANGGTNVSDSLKVEVVATWTPRNDRMYMSGTIDGQAVTEYGYTRSVGSNICLFKGNGWNQSNSYWVGRIYALSIIDNGALVRNFVPVRRNSDQLVGMYDLVTGNFYGNAESQTVNFAAGPVVPNQKASWSMAFGANAPLDARYNVNGSAKCNATLGVANTAATSSQMSANNWTSTGKNCWCSIDMVTELNNNNISTGKNIWVWLEVPSGETCAVDCASNCADAMASGAAADKPFRQVMTGM